MYQDAINDGRNLQLGQSQTLHVLVSLLALLLMFSPHSDPGAACMQSLDRIARPTPHEREQMLQLPHAVQVGHR